MRKERAKFQRGLSIGLATLFALLLALAGFTWMEISGILLESEELTRVRVPLIRDLSDLHAEILLQSQLVESGAIAASSPQALVDLTKSTEAASEIYGRIRSRGVTGDEGYQLRELERNRADYLAALASYLKPGQGGVAAPNAPGTALEEVQRPYFEKINQLVRAQYLYTDLAVERTESATKKIKIAIFVIPAVALLLIGLLSGWIVRAVVKRIDAEGEARTLAYFDSLTKIPNRRLAYDRLRQAQAVSERDERTGALILLDVDNFKFVNDRFGHAVGDQLLVQLSARLVSCVRKCDTVARMGGDEFLIILEKVDGSGVGDGQSQKIAAQILARISAPYEIAREGQKRALTLHGTASLGITLFKGRELKVDELILRADLAMYQAKVAGRNQVRFYSPEMQEALHHRAKIEEEVRQSLQRGDFTLHFQPIVDADSRITGAEALLRWNHPTRGLLPPSEFLGIAEEAGLMPQLGRQVLRLACQHLHVWGADPMLRELTLSVNVSASQLGVPQFAAELRKLLDDYAIERARLILELTESVLLDETEVVAGQILEIVQMGISIELDDFGTGYSSLSYLRQLPIQGLKIDRSFVNGMMIDATEAAIVRTIVTLGLTLGLEVVAEGVETPQQRDALLEIGCTKFQGYLYGRPESAGAFRDGVLDRQSTAPVLLSAGTDEVVAE